MTVEVDAKTASTILLVMTNALIALHCYMPVLNIP